MIFFGAGAPTELGLPTLQDLSKDIFKELKRQGHEEIIDRITFSLKEFDIKVDFESVYSIVEGLINPLESIKRAGPFTAYLLKKKENIPDKKNYKELLIKMRELLYEKCHLDQSMTQKIKEIYDPLFNSIQHHNIMDNIVFSGSSHSYPLDTVIASTNYDMSIELYMLSKGIGYIDGFVQRTGTPIINDFVWEQLYQPFNYLKYHQGKAQHILLKLHGSIWQFEKEGKMIKTLMDPRTQSPIEIGIGETMMIFPTKEKEILSWNYYQFFNCFKKIEWKKLLVIGYSFRDESINRTIIDRMKLDAETKLIVFNPHPDDVLLNLGENLPDDRVIKIPQYFGTPAGKKAVSNLSARGV